jgi:deoxyinosine 3'endonuclease (endonuclease V)
VTDAPTRTPLLLLAADVAYDDESRSAVAAAVAFHDCDA